MSGWTARRFWSVADAVREDAGWSLRLDGRAARTPSGRPLVVPTEAMASALAVEWEAQEDIVDPATMPVTRAANTAIDKVADNRDAVVAGLAAYGETDLLCYRAESPEALSRRQATAWDPLLEWAEAALGARLVSVAGVMPRPQDAAALNGLAGTVASMNPFALTGLHDLVTLSGSLVLGLAVDRGRLPAAEAWALSRIDEDYQAELWGRDEEADLAAAIRRDAFIAADRFVSLSRDKPLQA